MLIGSLVTLITILVTIWLFNISQKNKRIDSFVNEYFKQKEFRQNISALGLAGINNLKRDCEIKNAFEQIKNRSGNHPLLSFKDKVEKIGYKNFFNWVAENGHSLSEETIGKLLSDYTTRTYEK